MQRKNSGHKPHNLQTCKINLKDMTTPVKYRVIRGTPGDSLNLELRVGDVIIQTIAPAPGTTRAQGRKVETGEEGLLFSNIILVYFFCFLYFFFFKNKPQKRQKPHTKTGWFATENCEIVSGMNEGGESAPVAFGGFGEGSQPPIVSTPNDAPLPPGWEKRWFCVFLRFVFYFVYPKHTRHKKIQICLFFFFLQTK